MANFTFIMEYRGGTYVSQAEANSIEEAISVWASGLAVDEIPFLGKALKNRLIEKLSNDFDRLYGATALRGLTNVWYISVPLPGAHTMINAVKTDVG